jgi:uncharacterized protein (DUF1697 family)
VPAYVALLRGINVGGHHKMPMPRLREICVSLGLADVATYIQSGNVVFSSSEDDGAQLGERIEEAVIGAFGFEVPIVMRSAPQLRAVLTANPFLAGGADAAVLSVGFLGALPEPAAVGKLLADPLARPAAGGDEFTVVAQEVFLYHPNGYGRTKLTSSFFDRRLGTTMTVRNWRTVMTLVDMVGQLGR